MELKTLTNRDLRDITPVMFLFISMVLPFITVCGCSSSVQKTEVSQEAQHRTKVWLLERHQQIEHPLITELFQRSLLRLEPGIQSLTPTEKPLKSPRLYVIASEEVSAFSLCDGSIFITSHMLEKISSSEIFMAVLAHELAHVINHDACWVSADSSLELSKEIDADATGARVLYVSFINPDTALQALSLYYRTFATTDSKKFISTLEERKKALSDQLQQYPPIQSRVPEERLFRKVKHLVSVEGKRHVIDKK